MYKRPVLFTVFIGVLLLAQGCSWFVSKPELLEGSLLEVLQTSMANPEAKNENVPVRVHYEFKHKPLPHQEMTIVLEIKPAIDLVSCAYAVKLSEGLEIIEPAGFINLSGVKAGETYIEEIILTPVSEGLHEVKLFIATETTAKQSLVKRITIPISVGRFEKKS